MLRSQNEEDQVRALLFVANLESGVIVGKLEAALAVREDGADAVPGNIQPSARLGDGGQQGLDGVVPGGAGGGPSGGRRSLG